MRVSVRVPGSDFAESVHLEAGQTLVVGRRPDPDKVQPGDESTRAMTVAAPAVSSNHAMVKVTADSASVVDLGSRNGTWLRVPASAQVAVSGAESLSLELAAPLDAAVATDMPGEARWDGRRDFASSLVSTIGAWLVKHDPSARVDVVRSSDIDGSNVLGRFTLATAEELWIRSERTMDVKWLDVLSRAGGYVARQNMLFDAEQELREEGLIVASSAMKAAVRQVIEAVDRGARGLILVGPSGAGKEGLAQCFHRRSRPEGAFVSRNCGLFSFSKDLVISELFGAERGSFTGAVRPIVGAVEAASGGTLFLDEVGELALDVQAALLRFLDHGEYHRLGRERPLRADVQIVCATNKNLRAACLAGEFRSDLWFRLSTTVVEVPPLSQRFEDIVAYLSTRSADSASTLFERLSPAAIELLRAHSWDGNFRELVNFAQRLPRNGETIDADACRRALSEGALRPVAAAPAPPPPGDAATGGTWSEVVERARGAFEQDHGVEGPRSWDEVKLFIEAYVKPLLFARLSGVEASASPEDFDLGEAADRVQADRGTARKQIARYLARFAPKPT